MGTPLWHFRIVPKVVEAPMPVGAFCLPFPEGLNPLPGLSGYASHVV